MSQGPVKSLKSLLYKAFSGKQVPGLGGHINPTLGDIKPDPGVRFCPTLGDIKPDPGVRFLPDPKVQLIPTDPGKSPDPNRQRTRT
jgi:hypothetical protein